MRVVIDTNVVVSALLWKGVPGEMLALARNEAIRIYTSAQLLDEIRKVLHRGKFADRVQRTGQTADELVRDFRAAAWLVRNRRIRKQISRDADDDAVLACAAAARADLIVSGDGDLLSLKAFRGVEIVAARGGGNPPQTTLGKHKILGASAWQYSAAYADCQFN